MSPLIFFLTGLALFLAGIYLVAAYSRRIVGPEFKERLKQLGDKIWFSLSAGLFSTALLQSSSLVSSIAVGLAGAGVVSVVSGIVIAMGADVGTTVTAQLIAFPILEFGPWIAAGAAVLWVLSKSRYLKILGASLFSFGLIFSGLFLMKDAVSFMSESNAMLNFVVQVSQFPWLFFATGIILTAVMQSSSATIGIVIALVLGGILEPNLAVPFVLGANVGTTVTANLASLVTPYKGKLVARSSFILNLAGTVAVMFLLPYFLVLVDLITPPFAGAARFVANSHTLFNVLSLLVFLPLVRYLPKIAVYLVKRPQCPKKY